jgi:hypothetical protein
MPAKPTAFLSYHRASATPIARTIHDRLNVRGADVFYDLDMLLGQQWQLILSRELSRRDYHLVVLTPATVGSTGVLDEINLSLQQGKTIIPIMAAGFSFGLPNLPPEIAALSNYTWVEYQTNDPDTAIERLADAMGLPKSLATAAQTVTSGNPDANKKGMSTEVKVAIIVGIFGIITTILTGFFGLAPSLIPLFLRSDPTPTATFTLSPTLAITDTHTPTSVPPTETLTLTPTTLSPADTATVTATGIETSVPTDTPMTAPVVISSATTIARNYPCEATIIAPGSDATTLQIVRSQPSLTTSTLLDPIRVGQLVLLTEKRENASSGDWYRIAELDGTLLGWVPVQNIMPSAACPL